MNDLKAAARAGDTKALAQLMNQSFGPKGINVKVARSGPVLKVLMECDRLPNRKLAGAVRKGLDGIKPAGVEKVFLKAQSSGGEDSWIEQWSLSEPQPVATNPPVFLAKDKKEKLPLGRRIIVGLLMIVMGFIGAVITARLLPWSIAPGVCILYGSVYGVLTMFGIEIET